MSIQKNLDTLQKMYLLEQKEREREKEIKKRLLERRVVLLAQSPAIKLLALRRYLNENLLEVSLSTQAKTL